MKNLITLALVVLLGACSTPGTTTTPVSANAAQTARDLGSAQATETGSANIHNTPVIVNALAAKKVTVTVQDGKPVVEVEANDNAEVEVKGAYFGNVRFGNDGNRATVSSGGGAAGGTGQAERVSGVVPPTGGGGN